jgi:hypothetical protein
MSVDGNGGTSGRAGVDICGGTLCGRDRVTLSPSVGRLAARGIPPDGERVTACGIAPDGERVTGWGVPLSPAPVGTVLAVDVRDIGGIVLPVDVRGIAG